MNVNEKLGGMQMKKIDKKKIIIAIVVIVAIVLVIWGISSVLQPSIQKGNDEVGEFVIIAEDGTKVNTSEQLKKDKTKERAPEFFPGRALSMTKQEPSQVFNSVIS